jgi:predicted ATP-grasp superfamily ATP-dependent carboligase
VLVTDGANRVALAVVRALGRAGAHVTVVEQERYAVRTPAAFVSKYAARRDILPSLGDEEAFVASLGRSAADVDVIVPVSTNVVLACARHRERFRARIPIPPLATIRRANDKSSALAAARKAGVPIPATWAPESEEELEGTIGRMRMPAIVKLRDDEGTALDPGDRYAVCETGEQIFRAWRRLHAIRPFPLVQERVRGEGFGVGVLAKDGRVLASVAHRRIREYPVSGGPSSCCETVADERLERYASLMVAELGWTGVAMVEFKKDDDYRLMEVNPRFWGALPLAEAAGVNFPDLLCRLASGEEPGERPVARPGVRLRFLPLDLAAAWQALGDPERRARYVGGFLADLLAPGVRDGILEWGDAKASFAFLAGRLP